MERLQSTMSKTSFQESLFALPETSKTDDPKFETSAGLYGYVREVFLSLSSFHTCRSAALCSSSDKFASSSFTVLQMNSNERMFRPASTKRSWDSNQELKMRLALSFPSYQSIRPRTSSTELFPVQLRQTIRLSQQFSFENISTQFFSSNLNALSLFPKWLSGITFQRLQRSIKIFLCNLNLPMCRPNSSYHSSSIGIVMNSKKNAILRFSAQTYPYGRSRSAMRA